MSKNDDKRNAPMDDSIKEAAVGTPATNAPRQCWAMKTLIKEVQDLFPETTYEVSNIDGRNTALDVTFDLTMLDSQARADMLALFVVFDLGNDPRVEQIIGEDGMVLVSFKSNARTQDDRTEFGLADAYSVLVEEDDPIDHDETFAWGEDEGSM